MQYGTRWSEIVRSESNITTPDDPPTQPLHEMHELGHGQADFSNFVDKNEDVSTAQALTGLGSMLLFCYGVYRYSGYRARTSTPLFTLREYPEAERDIPTWKSASSLRKGGE